MVKTPGQGFSPQSLVRSLQSAGCSLQSANTLINPTFERFEKSCAQNNGEGPFGHEINEENKQGSFAVLIKEFPERCFDVHSSENRGHCDKFGTKTAGLKYSSLTKTESARVCGVGG